VNNKNFLDEIYDDFFGIEKLEKEINKLKKEVGIKESETNIPKIEVSKNNHFIDEKDAKFEKEDRDKLMLNWFCTIDKLYIKEESKKLLKKIIEYMRRYNEQIEKNYISFNIQLISNNKENIEDIVNIFEEAIKVFHYTTSQDFVEVSMYRIEKPVQIQELYEDKYGLVYISDLNGYAHKDYNFKEDFKHTFSELIKYYDKTITILSCNTTTDMNEFFLTMPNLKSDYFDFIIEGVVPTINQVYNEVSKILDSSGVLTEEMKEPLLEYIENTFPASELSFPEYRTSVCKYMSFNKEVPHFESNKTMEEIFAQLNDLVGLEKVKKVLTELVDLMELKKKTKDELKISNVNLHMVFLGNPGTGKTTVARIVAEILYNLKYIKQNKMVEVSSKDLVGEYVGQTAPKTMSVVNKAMGGVLFIDEAYTLASTQGSSNQYNEEAVATLIKAMEDYRDDFVVIFAGYSKEMQAFLNTNSGIVSRVGYTLEFEDYTKEELTEIFIRMIKKSGFEVSDDAIEELHNVIDEYKDTENFGNARFVRNVCEKSIIKHASNVKDISDEDRVKLITKDDISTDQILKM